MAQMVRAILLAKAMATSILGLRASIRANHDPSGIVRRPNQLRRDIAPIIKSLRISDCPALKTRPSRAFPPEENWRGTRPSQAAKSRPLLKCSIGGAKASTARAVSGPTPGIVCNRRAVSLLVDTARILVFLSAIRAVRLSIWPNRSRHSSRTRSGLDSESKCNTQLCWVCNGTILQSHRTEREM